MKTKSISQKCSDNCLEDTAEYRIKFIISKLEFLNQENEKEMGDITLIITFDSNVIRLENIELCKLPIGCEIPFQASPSNFAKKLKTKPMMMNLYSDSKDLGILTKPLENFSGLVICDDFECHKYKSNEKFIFEGVENANIEIVIEISRQSNFINPLNQFIRNMQKIKNDNFEEISVSFSDMSSSYDIDPFSDIYPADEENSSKVYNSNKTSSSKSKSVKCQSDIATSLDIECFTDRQKIFCNACGGFSISGITCEGKVILESLPKSLSLSSSKASSKLNQKCTVNTNRICPKCFDDLTVLPENFPCPKCKVEGESKIDSKSSQSIHVDKKLVESFVESAIKKIFGLDEKKEEIQRKIDNPKSLINNLCQKKSDEGKQNHTEMKLSKKKKKSARKILKCSKVKRLKKTAKQFKSLRLRHPGVVRGHKDCQELSLIVPRNMGWLWNVKNPGINEDRYGWRPGAIKKSVAKIIEHFKKEIKIVDSTVPTISIPESKSTLKVEKKAGEYTIMMNPKKKNGISSDDANSTPIVFKLTKNNEAKNRTNALMEMKNLGIDKICSCRTIDECQCLNNCEKLLLKREMKKISEKFCLYPALTWNDLDEINESEFEFEFTPPSEMANKKKIIRFSNEETQYESQVLEKCPSIVIEKMPVMAGKYQMMKKKREERLKKMEETKEKEKKLKTEKKKAQQDEEKLKKININKPKKIVKSVDPAMVKPLKSVQSTTSCSKKCFDPCGIIRCAPKVYQCNSVCQPCLLPKCEIPRTCSKLSIFYQQRCFN